MRDETMIQEAVLDSIDMIDEATLVAEYDVLMAMGETYIKSALIMEAASGEETALEELPKEADDKQKEKWYKRAFQWIIDGIKLICKKIKNFFKNLGKGTISLADGIYANAKGVTRVKVSGDRTSVKLDYDPDEAYRVFTEILNFYKASNDGAVTIPKLKKVTKSTSMEFETYKSKLNELGDILEELITVLQKKKSDATMDFSKLNSEELNKITSVLEVTSKLNTIVTANNMEIAEIIAKREADKHTMNKKEMKEVRDVL